ncbi:LLM class flavin-dependent oxidoreductase [Actinomycetes bacterium KLBMP 9759]
MFPLRESLTCKCVLVRTATAVNVDEVKFGVMLYPDVPFPELQEQARRVEELGFDQIFLPDHAANLRDLSGPWFDGLTALTVVAQATSRVRVGMLVANPILRPPAVLARHALSVDHLSGGRLELGLGSGVFDWDHHAVGSQPWPPAERARRFVEYLTIVDGVLRGTGEPFTFHGEFLNATDVRTVPSSVQRPRPPIIVGGQGPTMLRMAAESGDVWNTIGPMGADAATVLEVTGRQNRRIDELAVAVGRDPATIRRSLALYGPWDPWVAPVKLTEVVDRFGELGLTEFVMNLPEVARMPEFERMATDEIPALRGR